MKINAGNADRIVRIVIGLVSLSLVFFGPESNWGLFGLIPLITGLAGSCPLYSIFGLNSCPVNSSLSERKSNSKA